MAPKASDPRNQDNLDFWSRLGLAISGSGKVVAVGVSYQGVIGPLNPGEKSGVYLLTGVESSYLSVSSDPASPVMFSPNGRFLTWDEWSSVARPGPTFGVRDFASGTSVVIPGDDPVVANTGDLAFQCNDQICHANVA